VFIFKKKKAKRLGNYIPLKKFTIEVIIDDILIWLDDHIDKICAKTNRVCENWSWDKGAN